MKSMRAMQEEMLAIAKWDGSYPKAVCLFPGIVALAFNEEQWNKYNRENEICLWVLLIVFGACIIGTVIAAFWLGFW